MSFEVSGDRVEEPASKKQKNDDNQNEKAFEATVDQNGDSFFELPGKRRVTVRTFKSKILVDIREVSSIRSDERIE